MILPIRTDTPLRSIPWMNWLLILANVVLFAVQRSQPQLTLYYALSPQDPHLLHFVTYAFLHGNMLHLGSNLLFLYIFGNNVNDKTGNLGYLALYLAGAVFAGVGYVVTSAGGLGSFGAGTPAPVLGASGAVSAVTGAYLVLFPRSNITILYWLIVLGWAEVPGMYFIIFYFAQDVVLNFAQQSRVAHMAHISGSVFGFAVCFGLLVLGLLPRDQVDLLALVHRWSRRRQYWQLVRQGYDPFGRGQEAGTESPQDLAAGQASNSAPAPAPAPADPLLREKMRQLRAGIAQAIAGRDLPGAARLYLQLRDLDRRQVLSRQAQLDVANQLAHEQRYADAAEAYEQFLRHYADHGHEQVRLMLGLIYARHLGRPEPAREHLREAIRGLHDQRELDLARTELARIESPRTIAEAGPS